MSKKNKNKNENKGKILPFPDRGSQRKGSKKTKPLLKDWSPTKRQWPLIAVAAVIAVMLFKDTRHIKQTVSNHKETIEKMNKNITRLSKNSEYSKPESLIVKKKELKAGDRPPAGRPDTDANGLKTDMKEHVKELKADLEKDIKELKADLKEDIKELKADLKDGQDKLEKKIDKLLEGSPRA